MNKIENFGNEKQELRVALMRFDDAQETLFDFDEYDDDRISPLVEINDIIDDLDFARTSLVSKNNILRLCRSKY